MVQDIRLPEILETILHTIHEGVIVTDREGMIVFYNEEMGKLEGLVPNQVMGKHLSTVYKNVTINTSEHLQVIKSEQPLLEICKQYFTSEGQEINIVASTFPVFREDRVVAAYSVCRDITRIKQLLTKTMLLQDQIKNSESPARRNGTRFTIESIVYAGPAISRLLSSVRKTAEADCAVLVFGETGTGKELFVQAIHNCSSRKDEPFVAINCAAIPETLLESTLFGTAKGAFTGAMEGKGLFEQAGKGSLYLDEIDSMSINLQAKLLRVLQERTVRRVGATAEIPVECRVFSSTNIEPWDCIDKGLLRRDLFYRLAVISLYIPPLRERPEDVEVLLDHFLRKYQRIYGSGEIPIAQDLREILLHYQWPGNVRELEHMVESAVNLVDGKDAITLEQLPPYFKSKFQTLEHRAARDSVKKNDTLATVLREVEKELLLEALEKCAGNISQAAASLGIARQNMQYRIKKLGINAR